MQRTATLIVTLTLLVGASIALQAARERMYPCSPAADPLLYIPSAPLLQKLALSYDAVLADVYWIRAIQHFGSDRRAGGGSGFIHLYPLLDIATSLDPRFAIAYRFGALFLAEPFPGGAGRPDQAISLLRKGLRADPNKWQYLQDIGFVYYWQLRDFSAAAEHFERAGARPGAPWWLRPLAATTLAKGGQRSGSRLLWQQMYETATDDWQRRTARMKLLQLDALDQIDRLVAVASDYEQRTGRRPQSWSELVQAGLLRGVPVDPAGAAYVLDPASASVTVARSSPLFPLPAEPPASGASAS